MYIPRFSIFDEASSTLGFSINHLTLQTLLSISISPTIPYFYTFLGSINYIQYKIDLCFRNLPT